MGFIQSTKNYYTKCMDFRSRASRSEYWWGVLGFMILIIIINILIIILAATYAAFFITIGLFGLDEIMSFSSFSLLSILVLLVLFIFAFLFLFLAPFSLTARRLNDVTKSGWWDLIFAVPILGLIPLLYWTLQKGDEGENRFGPNPLTRLETHIQNTET